MLICNPLAVVFCNAGPDCYRVGHIVVPSIPSISIEQIVQVASFGGIHLASNKRGIIVGITLGISSGFTWGDRLERYSQHPDKPQRRPYV